MSKKAFQLKVPGSTSNIGPGFDSIGIAVNLYLTLECYPSSEWEFVQKDKTFDYLPKGKDNMIYEVVLNVAKQFGIQDPPPYRVEVLSDIPIARGLGSSGAITVSGIEIANEILELNLSLEEKIKLAAKLEGHPDNITPSFLGGCVVSYFDGEELFYVQKQDMGKLELVAMIPNFELRTKTAREVLPKELPFFKSIEGSAIGNVCTAAIFQENYALLGELMEKECFHQPYRKKLIPNFDEHVEFMKKEGAYGSFLSGAGPTILSIFEKGKGERSLYKWNEAYPDAEFKVLQIPSYGAEIKELVPIGEKNK